jgi:hypothetical protein
VLLCLPLLHCFVLLWDRRVPCRAGPEAVRWVKTQSRRAKTRRVKAKPCRLRLARAAPPARSRLRKRTQRVRGRQTSRLCPAGQRSVRRICRGRLRHARRQEPLGEIRRYYRHLADFARDRGSTLRHRIGGMHRHRLSGHRFNALNGKFRWLRRAAGCGPPAQRIQGTNPCVLGLEANPRVRQLASRPGTSRSSARAGDQGHPRRHTLRVQLERNADGGSRRPCVTEVTAAHDPCYPRSHRSHFRWAPSITVSRSAG